VDKELELQRHHPGLSTDAIAVQAVEHPDYAEEFREQHGAFVVPAEETASGQPEVEVPSWVWPDQPSANWKGFVARLLRVMLPDGRPKDEPKGEVERRESPGAKSRWRRADLETIFVKQPRTSARRLAESGDLVEELHHQRISELRGRGDVRAENGNLVLPPGVTGEGAWIILPKPD
jgi:hypothetical protein